MNATRVRELAGAAGARPRHRAGALLSCLALAAVPSLACAGKPDPAAAVKKASARLEALLRDEAKRAGKPVVTGQDPGPLKTTVVRAAIQDAYPGSGVARVVVWNGRTYGKRGERDLADLARERGWLKKAPDAAALARLVGDAQFDGLLAIDEAAAPAAATGKEGLSLSFTRRTFPGNAAEPVRVVIGSKGPAVITIGGGAAPAGGKAQPAKDAPAANPLADAARALESGGAAERSSAIAALGKSKDPGRFDLLARATLLPSEQLATDALVAIGGSPDAVAALRKAWAGIDAARRARLSATAGEVYGPAVAAELARP